MSTTTMTVGTMTDDDTPRPAVGPAPVYPLPDREDDPRFTFGLMVDVADVLAAHGYPRPTAGADLVRLQQIPFRYIYVTDGCCDHHWGHGARHDDNRRDHRHYPRPPRRERAAPPPPSASPAPR